MDILDKMKRFITNNYKTDEDSNIGKLMSIIASEISETENTVMTVDYNRDVDVATGVNLEKIGSNFGEVRGGKSDETYRQYIKTRMRANLSGGEMETLIEVLNVFFSGNLKSIEESWNVNDGAIYDGEPANIVITFYSTPNVIPYEAIDRVVAGGVGAYYFNEEVRDRFLALNTEIKQWESFYKKSGSTYANDTTNNLSEGGIGPSGKIYNGELHLETRESENGEIFNRVLPLVSNMLLYEEISIRSGTSHLNENILK